MIRAMAIIQKMQKCGNGRKFENLKFERIIND